jgi:hypothetical protein
MELLVAAVTQRNESVDPTGRNTRNQMEKVALAAARVEAQERVVDLVVILVVQVDVLEGNPVDIQVVLVDARVDVLEENQVDIQVDDLEGNQVDIQVDDLEGNQVDIQVDDLEENQVDIQVDDLEENQVDIQAAKALQTEEIALGTINVESIKLNF